RHAIHAAARAFKHEIRDLGRDFFGRTDEIAFILAIFVVDNDDDATLRDRVDRFLYGRKGIALGHVRRTCQRSRRRGFGSNGALEEVFYPRSSGLSRPWSEGPGADRVRARASFPACWRGECAARDHAGFARSSFIFGGEL